MLVTFLQHPALTAALLLTGPLKLDYVWAGACVIGAVYFTFRA